jgi:hypothetical protein
MLEGEENSVCDGKEEGSRKFILNFMDFSILAKAILIIVLSPSIIDNCCLQSQYIKNSYVI